MASASWLFITSLQMQIRAFLKLQIYLAALHDYALIWKGEGKGVSRLAIESYSLWKKQKIMKISQQVQCTHTKPLNEP